MKARGRFVWWLAQRLGFALVLAGLTLAGLGLWQFLREPGDPAAHRREAIRTLTREAASLKAALGGTLPRMAGMRIELAAQRERAEQAGRVGRQLDELSSGLNRLTTDAAQLQENKVRLARMQQMMADSLQRAAELEHGRFGSIEQPENQIAGAR